MLTLIVILATTMVCSSAHTLTPWRNTYTPSLANSTYSFGFMNCYHIDGKNIKYYWNNSTSKSYFNQAITGAFTVSWNNLISGTEITSITDAHITIMYDPIEQPANIVAVARNTQGEGHYILGDSTSKIIFYKNSKDKSADFKRTVAAHEIGHFWNIADFSNRSLDSIYSNSNIYDSVSRHDFNAMRIAINDLWFNPGGNQVWKYQPTPGTFILRGDLDQNGQITADDSRLVLQGSVDSSALTSLQTKLADVDGDGQITANDSRYVLRYSVALETKFPADIYEG